MDKIKGLISGFFHTWECGNSAHRTKVFNKEYKEHVNKGLFIRDIQCAPRDARYRIDHYYRKDTTEKDSLAYPNLAFHTKVLKYMNIDESFFWKSELVDTKSEYNYCDFTIGYKEFTNKEVYPISNTLRDNLIFRGFYFKYKGDINTLRFNYSPVIVDYTDKFWKEYKDKILVYNDIDTLLHNIRYFMLYKKLINP